ncbi:hypothetical protein PPYR_11872 [Photinus pyralis]|uniref:Kinase n=1 Tax=Photinus pyralis TaxID=7054 RepID=A0A5N4ACH9_PHOPY|nr:hypothetical protein PPYR_11872 [Photinus pyralis]
MCVNHLTMIPMYLNVVAAKGKDTYAGLISELNCVKCRVFSTNDKDIQLSRIWKSRPSSPVRSEATQTGFKRWRKNSKISVAKTQAPEKCKEDEMSLLKFLAINALDLSAPASDVLLKSRSSNWFQLSGHPDSLAPAGPGTVWKKRSGNSDDTERAVYEELSQDILLRDIIPKYYRQVDYQGEKFIELQDLLHGFQDPHVIDVKMGTRTFLESEVKKKVARNDLYQKMIAIDPNAPTAEEHEAKAVTKLRYMQFREQQSSSCSYGFRIEAMKCRGSPPITDLKKMKSKGEVMHILDTFLGKRRDIKQKILSRLCEIRSRLEQSDYFKNHEVIGSSLFIIYDDTKVGAWLIDFAKTNSLPVGMTVNHRSPWTQGNHEEGFLFGVDQLITMIENTNTKDNFDCNNFLETLPMVSSKS